MKMELIAALLHRPRLLLLDEPTIGLDVVAQATIQKCLKEYNVSRGVTMLLTSHYMRDVEALCSRVLVISHGKVIYDGPLAKITQQFGQSKLVKLHFAGDSVPNGLERFGEVTSCEGPVADLKVERGRVAVVHGLSMPFTQARCRRSPKRCARTWRRPLVRFRRARPVHHEIGDTGFATFSPSGRGWRRFEMKCAAPWQS